MKKLKIEITKNGDGYSFLCFSETEGKQDKIIAHEEHLGDAVECCGALMYETFKEE